MWYFTLVTLWCGLADGGRNVTWLTNFLGFTDNKIILVMTWCVANNWRGHKSLGKFVCSKWIPIRFFLILILLFTANLLNLVDMSGVWFFFNQQVCYTLDINECSQQMHNCTSEGSRCSNKYGTYKCVCRTGYSGDGKVCVGERNYNFELTAVNLILKYFPVYIGIKCLIMVSCS